METGGKSNYFNPPAEEQEKILAPDLAKEKIDDSIKSLSEILAAPREKLVPFSGAAEVFAKEEPEAAVEEENSDLAGLSEMWREYLDPAADKNEKNRIFQKISALREEIAFEAGAAEVIFGFDGDISLVYSDGRQEKIFDNPGAPVISPPEAAEAEIFSGGSAAVETASEKKEFHPEDFNVPGQFSNGEAAKFFAKDSGYLDLSQVASLSAEVLQALRPRTGMTNLLGLDPEKIDGEARKILKSFAGQVLLQDDIRRLVDREI